MNVWARANQQQKTDKPANRVKYSSLVCRQGWFFLKGRKVEKNYKLVERFSSITSSTSVRRKGLKRSFRLQAATYHGASPPPDNNSQRSQRSNGWKQGVLPPQQSGHVRTVVQRAVVQTPVRHASRHAMDSVGPSSCFPRHVELDSLAAAMYFYLFIICLF